MSTTANRTRGAVPNKIAAVAATLALLTVPLPAGADGGNRTMLLSLANGQSLAQLADDVVQAGGRVLETLGLSDSLLVELPSGVATPAGSVVVPDVPMRANAVPTSYDAQVPTYRETIGLKAPKANLGAGVTVALLDTGVDPKADGLGKVEHVNVSKAPNGDGVGHGTFLAGLIAGNGLFKGVAPSARLVDVQVADAEGNTSLVTVLKGLEAVQDAGADVLNVSLSVESPLPPAFDPLSTALDRLWSRGVTVVTAAGNDGPKAGTIASPGNDPTLITVGSVDEAATAARADDTVAEFSARGKGATKAKPDFIAPGMSLVSTAALDSEAATANPKSLLGNGYMRGSGTSMSAAVVSGAAAAVLSVNGNLSPDAVKTLFRRTAYDADGFGTGSGKGGLDLAAALAAAPSARGGATTSDTATDGDWGPAEDDSDAWQAFSDAWEAGDQAAVKDAWKDLSWQTKQWASRAWTMAVVSGSVGMDESDFVARSWAARSWAFDSWLARSWAARSWAARSWAFDEWLARSWAGESWEARSWAARSWAADTWLARSWAARSWAARSWAARSWAARSWAARSWADDDWAARSWAARSWATATWRSGSWSWTV